MKKIRKAVIPAAGLGTRFLPITKAMPKEMLPIVNKPTIQYIVEEAIESGIEDIIIVTGRGKRAIEDYFDHDPGLEQFLRKKGNDALLKEVEKASELINIHYIRQKEPKGLGHAILCAKSFIGDEPFAVLLGDDITEAKTPCLQQLIEQYNQHNSSVVGVKQVPLQSVSRYGIIDPETNEGLLYKVKNFVEKPSIEEAPSDLGIIGRYVLTPEIFGLLESQEAGKGGEIQLTDAIERLNAFQSVYAYQFEGERYDVGEKLDYILTTMSLAVKDPGLRTPILEKMREILEESKQYQN
ncbi:UTP--glucose-1-phosphate uridylyltransferase [Bacillus sp. OV322]|uniref:UTP--glucose-1-phosphate uridylyltransferase GalU n=1 Tax=Bacillus sp. OV322 TaxID=1882764 RepID=UPI0008EDC642|nr:UTP--glucose-1-phosphate uridylyltransferase GalU [Bacillus sp. OV322]SFC00704.1 UTP--glucose-1-phosphate uridylyltransferase [Bacillus sp. OV322]